LLAQVMKTLLMLDAYEALRGCHATAVRTALLLAVLCTAQAATAVELSVTDNMVLWLKADAGLTVQNGRVTAWADQSGQGHHATATSSGPRLWENGAPDSGLDLLDFSNLDSVLRVADHADLNPGTGGYTVFVAGSPGWDSVSRAMLGKADGTSSRNPGYWVWASVGGGGTNVRVTGGPEPDPDPNPEPRRGSQTIAPTTDLQVLTMSLTGTGEGTQPGYVTGYRDGVGGWTNGGNGPTDNQYSLDVSPTSDLYIGGYGSAYPHRGTIGEILIYDTELTPADRSAVENYLMSRWSGTMPDPNILTFNADTYTAQLPWFYHDLPFETWQEHNIHNFEVNALPLPSGDYTVALIPDGSPSSLRVGWDGRTFQDLPVQNGRVELSGVNINNRMISLYVQAGSAGGSNPLDSVLVYPTGTTFSEATSSATPFNNYERDIKADHRAMLQEENWDEFYTTMTRESFGQRELASMYNRILDWCERRQELDPENVHHGAIYSEEDKYCFRDTAAAAVLFTHAWRDTGNEEYRQRALMAREYAYKGQHLEDPENPNRYGVFSHMLEKGMNRLNPDGTLPSSAGVVGVETGIITNLLVKTIELGLEPTEEDLAHIEAAATWMINNEVAPGLFRHHEGFSGDTQNTNALGAQTLARAYALLEERGENPPAAWLEAAQRGVDHYLEGGEAIGEWPYTFATIGRGQSYDEHNIPDQGMGFYHFLVACQTPEFVDQPGLEDAARRAARWWMVMSELNNEGPITTIDLDDTGARPSLYFSTFTWNRFTAAASLARIAELTGEDQWKQLALRYMEHVDTNERNISDPDKAPFHRTTEDGVEVVSWIQAIEWDGVLLRELIDGPATTVPVSDHPFPNATGQHVPIDQSGTGWAMRYEKTATGAVVNPSGMADDFQGKLSRYAGSEGDPGYLYFEVENQHVADDTEMLFYTEQTIDRSSCDIDAFTWYMNNNGSEEARIAIEIGDQWYVSDDTFSHSGDWGFYTFVFSTSAETWRELTFDDVDIAIAAETLGSDLPSEDISAFGMYVYNADGGSLIARLDDFKVKAFVSQPLAGDLNGDGFVGGDDLDIIRSFWGQTVTAGDLLQGDASGDGFVGGDDLDIIRSNWGQGTPPAASVIEPATSTLLLMGAAVFMVKKRRNRQNPCQASFRMLD